MKSSSLAILAVAAVMPHAQTTPASKAGTVEHIKVHGKALEGNL